MPSLVQPHLSPIIPLYSSPYVLQPPYQQGCLFVVKPIALAQSNAVAPLASRTPPILLCSQSRYPAFSAPRLTSLISNYIPICQPLCPSNIVSSSIPITLLHMTLFSTFLIAMVLTPLMSLFNLVLFMKFPFPPSFQLPRLHPFPLRFNCHVTILFRASFNVACL